MEETRICLFNSTFEHFALVSNDNRLRIWDTNNARLLQEFVDPQHLSQPNHYTCMAWGAAVGRGEQEDQEGSKTQTKIALGTEKGSILIFDVRTGNFEKTSNNMGHSARVAHLIFNKSGTKLFSCSEDMEIQQWDPRTGAILNEPIKIRGSLGGGKINAMALSADESTIAVAANSIKVYDLSSGKATKKFTGHGHTISSLSFMGDSYLVSFSSKSRFIYLWNCSETSEQKEPQQAFTCDSTPRTLAINPFSRSKKVHFLCLTSSGKIYIWEHRLSKGGKEKPINPAGSVMGTSIMWAQFSSKEQLVVVVGDSSRVVFEKINYVNEKGVPIHATTSVLPPPLITEEKKTTRKNSKFEATKTLGPTDMGLSVSVTQLSKEELEQEKTQIELLQSMTKKEKKPPGVLQANSIQIVLQQAIHNRDKHLLESCLSVSDPVIISNTMERLSTVSLIPFIEEVVKRFQDSPNRGYVWLRAALRYHAPYLMSVPDLVKTLSSLYLVVDSRLASYNRLLKLSGRLDLLTSQINQYKKRTQVGEVNSSQFDTYYNEEEDENEDESMDEEEEGEEEGREQNGEENMNSDSEDAME